MPLSKCGACEKYFASTSLFDHHRIGSYGESIKENAQTKQRSLGYKSSNRRCMTTEELTTSGYTFEQKEITITREGQGHKETHDVWYDPVSREKMRAVFAKNDSEDEDTE